MAVHPGVLLASASLAALLSGCGNDKAVKAGPIAFLREPAPHHTFYEHQDHRMLPVGTKIYYDSYYGGGAMWLVRPGDPVPAAFDDRKPDIVVVGPYDPRGNVVIERTR